jgi:hypothetical protein
MAHLLTIPREIRDRIYTYLTQDRNFYLRRDQRPIGSDLSREVDVHVKQAPLLSVLLTHSRLKEENLESAAFKGLSMTLQMTPENDNEDAPERDLKSFIGLDTSFSPIYNRMLAKVTSITVFVDCGDVLNFQIGYVWPKIVIY